MYDAGTTVKLSCAFRVTGTLTDPATVTLKVRAPSGDTNTYTLAQRTVSKQGIGRYFKDVVADEPGRWYYQWIGTGAAAGLDEKDFYVAPVVIQ